jgi:WD40 repeat protein
VIHVAIIADVKVKLYDRDGSEVFETLKGDPYIVDLARTHGHVSTVSTVLWNPANRQYYVTGSIDGYVSLLECI